MANQFSYAMPRNNSPFQNSNYNQMYNNPNGTKFCKYCGSNIPFGAVVCTACGCQVAIKSRSKSLSAE